MKLKRRTFLSGSAAALTVRAAPVALTRPPARRILTLVYDKALGGLRAVERVVR